MQTEGRAVVPRALGIFSSAAIHCFGRLICRAPASAGNSPSRARRDQPIGCGRSAGRYHQMAAILHSIASAACLHRRLSKCEMAKLCVTVASALYLKSCEYLLLYKHICLRGLQHLSWYCRSGGGTLLQRETCLNTACWSSSALEARAATCQAGALSPQLM